jgi:predicted RND superfamily exporter protein
MKPETNLLYRWGKWTAANPKRTLLITLVITIIMMIGFSFLSLEMSFYSIMPESSPQVKDMKAIMNEFPFSQNIVVVLDARNSESEYKKQLVINSINAITEELQSEIHAEYVDSVYGTVDRKFLENHGFMLSEPDELERLVDLYASADFEDFLANLNNDLEREFSGNNQAIEDQELQLVTWVNGLSQILSQFASSLEGVSVANQDISESLSSYLIGDPYYLNRDETMGLLFINPSYTIDDFVLMVEGTEYIDKIVREIAFNNGTQAGLTGFMTVGKDEMVTSEQGFALAMGIAFSLILILLIIVFRMRSTPIIIGLPLFLGIIWTAGLTGYFINRLSIVTAMYLVALVGLGVDYAIHILTGYVQERDRGKEYIEAIALSFQKNGRGIITGALTTAVAFLALLVAESELMQELALVSSMGILAELLAMFLLIPAILGLRGETYRKKNKRDPMLDKKQHIKSTAAGAIGHWIQRAPWAFILSSLILVLVLSIFAPGISIEDNIMNMEAEGLESVELQEVIVEEFGLASDVLYIKAENLHDIPELQAALEDLASVKSVDALIDWIPTQTQQTERRSYLEQIQNQVLNWNSSESEEISLNQRYELLLEELYRLEFNLIELGDLSILGGQDRAAFTLNKITGLNNQGEKVSNSVFDRLFQTLEQQNQAASAFLEYQSKFETALSEKLITLANTQTISLSMIPQIILDSFVSSETNASLISIAPKQNPWDGINRQIFSSQVNSVTDQATGMVLAADQLVKIVEVDGVRALIAALIAVFIILLLDFRNIKLTLLTFIPLSMAFLSLIGFMVLANIKFDFINIIAIPLLVGIGIDDTVHINHRYLLEGKGAMTEVLASTGTAILLTTITTMIGFASFIPSLMKAMQSTGIVLTLAMALAFVFSILFYPSLLSLVSEKWNWNLNSWTRSKSKNT